MLLAAPAGRRTYQRASLDFIKRVLQELAQRLHVLALAEEAAALRLETQSQSARNQFLEQLTLSLSHDLKSPLVSSRNLLEQLRFRLEHGQLQSEAEFKQQLLRLEHSLDRLNEYISMSLDREILELGRLELEEQAIDVNKVFENVLFLHEHYISSKQTRIIKSFPAEPVHILADRIRFEHVLSNLVSNALKYGKSLLICSIKQNQTQICIQVEDDGPGLEASWLEAFLKAPPLPTGADTLMSSGLGLSICYQYVKLMGGQLQLLSQSGSGACFELSFERLACADQPSGSQPESSGPLAGEAPKEKEQDAV